MSRLGLNLQLLGSQKYVKDKLEKLSSEQLAMLKEVSTKNGHPRLRKEFAQHQPHGRKAVYVEGVKNADLKKMVKLIKIVGMLLQSKVYLFWQNPEKES